MKNISNIDENFIKLKIFYTHKINNIRKGDVFLIEKIVYSPSFKKLINNVLQDNIFALMPNRQNDELSIFKKCLVDLLAYINILNKEKFNYFMQKNKEILIPFEQKIKKEYNNINFDDDINSEKKNKNNNKIFLKDLYEEKEEEEEEDDNKDADFKDILFPKIIDIVKGELNNNLDT